LIGHGWFSILRLVRGWFGVRRVSVVAALFGCLSGCSVAAELRAVRITSTADGAAVAIDLSEAVDMQVTEVADGDGTIQRLYVDLPRSTIVAPAARQLTSGAGPVAGTRIGQADNGAVRLVIDVEGAGTFRIERLENASTTVLVVSAKAPPPPPPVDTKRNAARRRGSTARPAPEKKPPEKPIRIVIDPGHGGTDPGAGSGGYAVEKDVTLAISQRLATLLRARLNAEVVLTRTDDTTLVLADRTARANTERADLFVSIHGNSSPNGDLHGVETYYLNNTDDRASIRLAAMENGLDLLRPGAGQQTDLRYILSDMIQVGKLEQSIQLARTLQRGLVRTLRTEYRDVRDLGVKQGPFYVLVGAYMPCVLVEVAFLNHPVEGPRLASEEYRELIAQGLYTGISQYLGPARRGRTL
jgi:N-acetylmuramoyl-L-alanine amidase